MSTGVVTGHKDKLHVVVELVDTHQVTALAEHVIVVGGATPCPTLHIADHVLVRGRNSTGPHPVGGSCDYYLPGMVYRLPEDRRETSARYAVLTHSKKCMACTRHAIIKIGKSRYNQICAYIKERVDSTPHANGNASIHIPCVPSSNTSATMSDLGSSARSHSGSNLAQHIRSQSGSRRSSAQHLRPNSGSRGSLAHSHSVSSPTSKGRPMLSYSKNSDDVERILEQQKLQGELLEHQQRHLSLMDLRQQDLESELKTYRETSPQHSLTTSVATPPATPPDAAPPDATLPATPHFSASMCLLEGGVTVCEQAVNTDVCREDRGTCTDPLTQARGTDPLTQARGTDPSRGTDPLTQARGTDPLAQSRGTDPLDKSGGVGTEWNHSDMESDKEWDSDKSSLASFIPSSTQLVIHTPSRTPPHQPTPLNTTPTTPLKTTPLNSTPTLFLERPLSPEGEDPLTNQHVLARWPDDGWYYRGVVVHHLDQMWYQVRDATHDIETIHAQDIIIDLQDAQRPLLVGDTVAALHPSFDCSYAPGHVMGSTRDGGHFSVQLYDNTETFLPRQEIYRLAATKHQKDVEYLRAREQAWVGQVVLARRDTDGLYLKGMYTCACACTCE